MKCTWLIDVTGDHATRYDPGADANALENSLVRTGNNGPAGSKSAISRQNGNGSSVATNFVQRNRTIRLRLNRFETECGWDHLYVFDGDSMFGQMIAAYSGALVPELAGETVSDLVANSGKAFIHFYSDAVYNMSGFNISYSVDRCPDDCSGQGTCDDQSATCKCKHGFTGDTCNIPVVTKETGRSSTATLMRIAGSGSGVLLQGRAMHQAVVFNHSMWVFGGKFFSSAFTQRRHLEVARYEFGSSQWSVVQQRGTNIPPNTYGHSLVSYKNSMYLYGGAHTFDSNNVTNALWRFDPARLEWAQVSHKEARVDCHLPTPLCPPVPAVGHAAVMVNQSMLVFFGHHPILGYLNMVQEYRIGSVKWELVQTRGAVVKGGFGQSAVYDERSQQVLIFGGYHSTGNAGSVVDYLYSYRPSTRSWSILRPSGIHRYLHSAALLDGVMLIFGGNTHNDTSQQSGDRCFAADTLAYDVECDLWQTVKIKESPNVTQGFRRFGHSAVTYNGSMYIFGGFNGRMLSDTLKLSPAHCEALDKECLSFSLLHGTKCIFATGEGCLKHTLANLRGYPQKKGANCSLLKHSSLPINLTQVCEKQTNCRSCLHNSFDCVWCDSTCAHKKCPKHLSAAVVKVNASQCLESESLACDKLHNCQACHSDERCAFKKSNGCIGFMLSDGNKTERAVSEDLRAECDTHCSDKRDCATCTAGQSSGCMWCSNLARCLETNAYAAMFPLGQCTEWSTGRCDRLYCSRIRSCRDCLQHERCGWCDDGSDTGKGRCMEGANNGPVVTGVDVSQVANGTEQMGATCIAPASWNFITCPACQCNGHSTCVPGTTECVQPCANNTHGPNCERCQKGYYGSPINGGACQPCMCNGHGLDCHHETGKCNCTTKGLIGKHCEACDNTNQYWGNPVDGGTCFYKLSIDFQYTFNLSHDDPFTAINFMNMPPRVGHDVEFQISCSTPALVNISISFGSPEPSGEPRGGLLQVSPTRQCGSFKMPLSHEEFKFGTRNATLYVHVFNLSTPAILQVAFSQHRALDLLQFFITFSSCFLSLLIIAAVLWKIKQKYDLYRRRQQLFVEMEQMASRPFAGVTVELCPPPYALPPQLHQPGGRPTPVALEPCSAGKAAVISLIVRLPRQDNTSAVPSGQSGIAIASALVSLSQLGGKGQQNSIRDSELQGHHKGDCWKPNTNVGTCL
ncbi:attractin-like isoform X3 [Varroa destructor]|nr:attractin-like isoform X3 [Varroa destructor]XP_022664549.1 attractin-like isoform X3 [Varroa destructor]